MTRNEIINRLRNPSEAYATRIASRLQSCNVRVVRSDGAVELNTEIRCRLQALYAMLEDESIAAIEYRFNNRWETV